MRIRKLKFRHDVREKAPLCRWTLDGPTVDIMRTQGASLGLNGLVLRGLGDCTDQEIARTRLRLISPTAFLATKYVAFSDRGDGDFYASHELENFITVIVAEKISSAKSTLRLLACEIT